MKTLFKLGLLLVLLKVLGFVNLSWIAVVSPLILAAAIPVIVIGCILLSTVEGE